MSDHVPGWICAALGLGAGAYTIYGWRKGRIRWRMVEERAVDPFLFWSAIVSASLWSLGCIGAGIYMILW
jgi:hypothetical protein